MRTIEYWVTVPSEYENPIEEISKRISGTDMTWEPYYGERAFLVRVTVDTDDEDILLEHSARKIYAAFRDIDNPAIEELPYPRTAHELIKYYDKQHRLLAGENPGYLRDAGADGCQVMFTVIVHSTQSDPEMATAECEQQICAIVAGQAMAASLDIPIRLSHLKQKKIPAYFANYRIAVSVARQENTFQTVAVAAETLWSRVKYLPVHVELDDMSGTLLEAIIKYFIPKYRVNRGNTPT